MLQHRIARLVGLIACVVCIGAALGPAWPGVVQAQEPDDWTAPYCPALLPDFVGDMAAHADAPRYLIDLNLDITPDQATLTGHQMVVYTNRTPGTSLDQVVFRLYPNLETYGGDMQVSHVNVDGVAVEPGLDETRSVLKVVLPTPLEPGAGVTLDMDFTITVYEGRERMYSQFSYLAGVLALPNAYPMLSVYEPSQGWWQVTDHPQGDAVYSETAFYMVNVTAPPTLILAASGSEVEMIANADGTLTHRYVAPLMRDFALMASQNYVTLIGEQDGVTITLYYDPEFPESEAGARAGLQMTQDTVRIYNATYGRYPFTELDVVQTPTGAGGIEYPGLFVVASNIWDKDEAFFEFVIAHEAAHQWWYSLVGNDQTLDPWMDEALAQYSVAIYIRDLEGKEAYQAALDSYRTQYNGYISTNADQVIGQPVTAYPEDAYFYFVYQKGPLFYAALDETYGYENVVRMLQDYLAAYRYEVAEPDDLLNSFESTLGEDLDAIFEEWIGGE
jgi:aminopeptidase N